MLKAGLDVPRAGVAHTLEEALAVGDDHRVSRSSCAPRSRWAEEGAGSPPIAEELATLASRALEISPVAEILVEESIAGWKEFELEVMRDADDNGVIVCSIENVDPMGVHTGDSITVAPQQTLTDREYQEMRDAALRVLRVIGVETGGSNVQFAVDPVTGRQVLIEMNPRVSRSSALASKATGFPIAKIAALLAVGFRLDEITNDITGETPVSFEPTLDYVVVKIPRFAFEKFPEADPRAHLHDEVGGRGHGDRPHLQGGARQGVARHREGPGSTTAPIAAPESAERMCSRRSPHGTELRLHLVRARDPRRATASTRSPRPAAIDPWFVDQIDEIVRGGRRAPWPVPVHVVGRRSVGRQAPRPVGRPHRDAHRRHRGRRAPAP